MKKTAGIAFGLLFGSPLIVGCTVHATTSVSPPPPPPSVVVEGQIGAPAGATAELVVQGPPPAPPPPQVEVVPASPGVEFTWIGGYHRWDGHAYVWTPGRYDHRPHPGAQWHAPHWEPRGSGHGESPGYRREN